MGRGRRQRGGLPEASESENLETDSTRPAPPEGGAANLKGCALCRRPLVGHRGSQNMLFGRPGASILAPWGTISAPWGHPGGPWEQQEGHLGVSNLILNDLREISGPHF